MMRRPPLLIILLLLVAGAIVNIAVAWGSAWFVPALAGSWESQFFIGSPDAQRRWIHTRTVGFGGCRSTVMFLQPGTTLPGIRADVGEIAPWTGWPGDLETGPAKTRLVEVRGWPAYAMRSRWISPTWASGIALPQRRSATAGVIDLGAQRALPLEPLWPGFAINTAIYALVVWVLYAVLVALRNRHRIKRGLCPKCAYDLRSRASDSSACPECGATHETK